MTDLEYVQRLFGTSDDGVLYLPGAIMKAVKVKPGDKLRIVPEKDGFKVVIDKPHPGGQP